MTKDFLKKRVEENIKSPQNNPGKTNKFVNLEGKKLKWCGRTCLAASVCIEAGNIYNAPEGEKLEETAKAGGRISGGILGGMAAGAAIGAMGGNPITIGIGAAVGGFLGSSAGEWLVSKFF